MGGVSGNWSAPGMWNPAGVPSMSGDTALIGAAGVGTYVVNVSNLFTIGGVTLNQPQAILNIGSGGRLAMSSGGSMNLLAGKMVIDGGSITQAGAGMFVMAAGSMLETRTSVVMPAGMTYSLQGSITMLDTLQGFPAGGFTNGGAITLSGPGLAWLFASGGMTNNGAITTEPGGTGRRLQAPITNGPTGVVTMNADTEWRSGPHTNLGMISLAPNRTLTVGSFATVNQNGGLFDVGGNYMHVNGAFNMNGGTLSVHQSFFKDGGEFRYNGGSIIGTPTLHNVQFVHGPGMLNPVRLALRGPNNGLSGDVGASTELRCEGTATEAAGLFWGPAGVTNHGTLTCAPSATHAARLGGGPLFNRGLLQCELPGTGVIAEPTVISAALKNEGEGEFDLLSELEVVLDGLSAEHRNLGLFRCAGATAGKGPASVRVKEGSGATFRQEAGLIDNGGVFEVGDGCTFEYVGGQCVGNPIVMMGATLKIGPQANQGSFECLGNGNVITADEIRAIQVLRIAADATRPGTGAGEALWDSMTGGTTPTLEGMVWVIPAPQLHSTLFLPHGLDVRDGGTLMMGSDAGLGTSIVAVEAPHRIRLTDHIFLEPGVVFTGTCVVKGSMENLEGRIRSTFNYFDGRARGGVASVLTVTGDFVQGGEGAIELSVAESGENDALQVSGTATLDGELAIGIRDGRASPIGARSTSC